MGQAMTEGTGTKVQEAPDVRAPRGTTISCKGWHQEAALRMLMNNLDAEVGENPGELIVYGGSGKAARNWEAYHAIVRSLRELAQAFDLQIQHGSPRSSTGCSMIVADPHPPCKGAGVNRPVVDESAQF